MEECAKLRLEVLIHARRGGVLVFVASGRAGNLLSTRDAVRRTPGDSLPADLHSSTAREGGAWATTGWTSWCRTSPRARRGTYLSSSRPVELEISSPHATRCVGRLEIRCPPTSTPPPRATEVRGQRLDGRRGAGPLPARAVVRTCLRRVRSSWKSPLHARRSARDAWGFAALRPPLLIQATRCVRTEAVVLHECIRIALRKYIAKACDLTSGAGRSARQPIELHVRRARHGNGGAAVHRDRAFRFGGRMAGLVAGQIRSFEIVPANQQIILNGTSASRVIPHS